MTNYLHNSKAKQIWIDRVLFIFMWFLNVHANHQELKSIHGIYFSIKEFNRLLYFKSWINLLKFYFYLITQFEKNACKIIQLCNNFHCISSNWAIAFGNYLKLYLFVQNNNETIHFQLCSGQTRKKNKNHSIFILNLVVERVHLLQSKAKFSEKKILTRKTSLYRQNRTHKIEFNTQNLKS